jgi:phosphatidylinositol glycan class F
MTSKVSTGLGPIPQFPPVAPLSSQAAQAFIHIHPFLLLSLFYIRFNALVADPVQTQLISLIPLAIIQISYVITCLPPAGSIIAGKVASPDKTRKTTPSGARRKAHSKNGSLATKVMVSLSPHSK